METTVDSIRRITAVVRRIENTLGGSNSGLMTPPTEFLTLKSDYEAATEHIITLEKALQTAEQRCKDFEELNSEYRQENMRLKASLQKIDDFGLAEENERLKQELRDIHGTAEVYQTQIADLRRDYQELREEYMASETRDGLFQQEREGLLQQVQELKGRTEELELRIAVFQRPAEMTNSRSSSPTMSTTSQSAEQICESLVSLLHLTSNDSILKSVRRLQHHSHVVRRLEDMIMSMSGSREQPLASNQIIKWVSQLASDYVAVQGALSQTKEILARLKGAAGVSRVEELLPKIQEMREELQRLREA